MPKIKFSEIRACVDKEAFIQKMKEIVSQCRSDDPIFISDCLANTNSGGSQIILFLSEIDEENRLRQMPQWRWKIEVLFDEWGNVPNPGDIIRRAHKKSLEEEDGKPIPGSVLSAMIRDGSYDDTLVFYTDFIVDEKGCIDCSLHDSLHFLNLWGIHGETRKSLTSKNPTSREPVLRNDGKMLHVHYHRYAEVDQHRYAKLKKRDTTDKR